MDQFKWFKYPFPLEVSSITILWLKKAPTDKNVIHLGKFRKNEQEAWFQLIHIETLSRVLNLITFYISHTTMWNHFSKEHRQINMFV